MSAVGPVQNFEKFAQRRAVVVPLLCDGVLRQDHDLNREFNPRAVQVPQTRAAC